MKYFHRRCTTVAAVLLALLSTADPLQAQPGPSITGFDWEKRWVIQADPCSKNTTNGYDGLLTLSNYNAAEFTVESLEVIGNDATAFALDLSDPSTSITTGTVIRPGGEYMRVQRVIFRPTEERSYGAIIRVTTVGGATIENVLRGIGTESHISIEGFDFGRIQYQGATTAPVSGNAVLTIKQTRPTTITDIRISGADVANFRFAWARGTAPFNAPPPGAAWTSIPAGTVIEIPLEFTPAGASDDARVAVVEVTGDFSSCDTAVAVVTGIASTSLSVDDAAAGEFTVSTDRSGAVIILLPYSTDVTLDLHDASGRHLARLADGPMEAGAHRIAIDRLGFVSGVYVYSVQAGGVVRTGRVVVVR